jgi:CHAD domain-containing protein
LKTHPFLKKGACFQPILDLARQRIYKRYRRVIKRGRHIVKDRNEDQMHALRIDCKKLRYLLEFFRDLFPGKPMKRLIKYLAQLQNNLGEFHDLAVQEDYLQAIAAEFPLRQRQGRQTLLAIGGLVEKLDAEKEAAKADFERVFAEFDSGKTERYFKKFFAVSDRHVA